MGVLIENRQKRLPISLKELRKKARIVLNALDCPDGEISIVIVDDAEITDLNRQYLFREGPTNVIAFPMREGPYAEVSPDLLGDVAISADTAEREAQNAGMRFEDRLDELLVHGILHLFGYDHVHSAQEAARMEEKTREMLRIMK